MNNSGMVVEVDTSGHFFPDRMRVEESGEERLPEISELLDAPTDDLVAARQALLRAVGCPLEAPPGVAITLLGDRCAVVQNFGSGTATVRRTDDEAGQWSLRPGRMRILGLVHEGVPNPGGTTLR